jgi:hypothetical protein
LARLIEVGDVPAVQNVEAAIGEYQRSWQLGDARGEIAGGDDLGFKGRGIHDVILLAVAAYRPVGLP